MNGLVEQYASAKVGHENLNSSIRRTAGQMKIKLMGVGLDTMAQLCGAIEQTAARGGQPNQKSRTLREHVGNLKFQLELAIRSVVREDEEVKAKEKAKASAAGKSEG